MKHQSVSQLQLFGTNPVAPRFLGAAIRVESYKTEGKGDAKKVVTFETGPNQGLPIVRSETIKMLPRSSKDGADLKDISGLTGQALMAFEAEVNQQLMGMAQAEFNHKVTMGYRFGRLVRSANGNLSIQIKPGFSSGARAASLTNEALEAEAKSRGLALVKADGTTLPQTKTVDVEATVQPAQADLQLTNAVPLNPAPAAAPAPAAPAKESKEAKAKKKAASIAALKAGK